MEKKATELQTGWDARQGYTHELIDRGKIYLDLQWPNVYAMFEALQDMFDFASCAMKNNKLYEEEFEVIEGLLYSPKNDKGHFKTQGDKEADSRRAYHKMRVIFRAMQKEIWDAGLYLPLYETPDPRRAMMDMGD